jgi:hypothetical protein
MSSSEPVATTDQDQPRNFDPGAVEAIVLDTNGFPHGQPNLESLRELAREADEEDLGLWLPEVVAWELAEHAAESYVDLKAKHDAKRKQMGNAGISLPALPYQSKHEAFDAVLASIEAIESVEILPCSPQAAREALYDQVTLRTPGRREKDVKTGAADSAWLRDVQEKVAHDTSRYVLVTDDNDIEKAFRAWNLAPPRIFPNIWNLRRNFFAYALSPPEAISQCLAFLRDAINNRTWNESIEFRDISVTDTVLYAAFGDGDPSNFVSLDVEVDQVATVLGISDVRVSRTRATILARVYLGVRLNIVGWQLDNNGKLFADIQWVPDVALMADLVFQAEGGAITSTRTEGDVIVEGPHTEFEDSDDALWACADHLSVIPGVDDILEELRLEEPIAISIGSNSQVNLRLEDPDDEWRLHATTDEGDEIVVKCDHDATAWVGGDREGLYIRPPYVLSVEGQTEMSWNPTWSLNEFIMSRLRLP